MQNIEWYSITHEIVANECMVQAFGFPLINFYVFRGGSIVSFEREGGRENHEI